MPTINQLSAVDQINDGDQFPLYSPNAGDARKASFTTVKESLADDFASLADLAAQTGAGLVGTSNGTTVQQALDSKPTATLDTDGTLAANSDGRVASQKATKTYADAKSTALAASSGSSLVGHIATGAGATARTVQAKLRDTVSVKDFGAVGDGVTDDTTFIQAAITYAQSSGKSLYIPSGTYLVSSVNGSGALNISAGLQVFGEGSSTILKLKAGSTGFVIYAYSPSVFTGLYLKDFVVDGNSVTTAQLDVGLVQILNASDFVVENLTVKNGTRASGAAGINGIAVADTAGNVTSGTIQNCVVENCSKALINWTTNARNGLIQNCILRNGTGNGLTPGLQINGGQNVKAISNYIYGNQGSGVLIGTDGGGVAPQFPTLIGNHIYGNGTGSSEGAGIKIVRAFGSAFGRVIIANNHIYENGVNVLDHGIVLSDDANVIIHGNYIYKNKLSAISMGGSVNAFQNVLIEGNIFDNNNQANNSSVGTIYAIGSVSNITIKDNRFVDSQSPSTTHYPIYTASGTFANWQVSGNIFSNYLNPQIVFFDTSSPASWSSSTFNITGVLQTTTASDVYVLIAPVSDNTACVLRISALGVRSGGGDRAYYDKENAMFRAGGALTPLGAVVTYYEQESDATWGGVSPTQTANVALAAIAGKAATTIDWSYTYRLEWK